MSYAKVEPYVMLFLSLFLYGETLLFTKWICMLDLSLVLDPDTDIQLLFKT